MTDQESPTPSPPFRTNPNPYDGLSINTGPFEDAPATINRGDGSALGSSVLDRPR
jgi:hypothetical protein